MARWLKVIVLLAGTIGLSGFFLPFFVFQYAKQETRITGYQLLVGNDDPKHAPLGMETTPNCVKEALPIDGGEVIGTSCDPNGPQSHRSYVPLYFLSSIAMLIAGIIGVLRRRMGGFLGLFTLAASLLAIGGWLRELRLDRINEGWHTAIGGTLLGVSGVVCLLATIGVFVMREPFPVKKTPAIKPTLPEARIIR